MNPNLSHLIEACHSLGIEYSINHSSGNLISVRHHGRTALFAGYTTPLNDHSTIQICQDKEFFYQLIAPSVRMPLTHGYLNPATSEKHRAYLEFASVEAIVADILNHFTPPLIVKKNRGSTGTNVFLAEAATDVTTCIEEIFNRHSYKFDYIALAQEYIAIAREYRIIYLNGKLEFAYEKNIEHARFTGNLSRLHWEGAQALLVDDLQLLQAFDLAFAPLFQLLPLHFCGLDAAIDHDGNIWLIEANSAPGFGYFVADGGGPRLIQFYERMLSVLFGL